MMQQAEQNIDVNDEGDLLRMAQNAYRGSSSFFDVNVRSRIIDDIHQFNSEHPEGSKYRTEAYRLKSKLFRPKTRTAIRKDEAIAAQAYFASDDVVSMRAHDDGDPLQVAAAAAHKELLQYRLTMPAPKGLPWFLTCLGAYQEARTVGIVCSYQDWVFDEARGIDRPDVTLIPVENFRFDPAADWRDVAGSSPYFIIKWPMYVKDIKKRMPQIVKERFEEEQPDGSILTVEREVWDEENRPWRYCPDSVLMSATQTVDTIQQTRDQGGTDSKKAQTSINDYAIAWVHQNFFEVDGELKFFYTLATSHQLSGWQLVKQRYPQGMPVVVGFSILEAHKGYKSSEPSLTRDIQGEINDVANLRIDNVKLRLNKRYFARRGGNVDLRSLTRNIPASVTMMENPSSDVKVVTTDDATSSSYQEQDRLNLDFDDLSGAFSGSSVQSNRQLNETVGGMNLLADNANMVSEYQLRTFTETWVEPVLRQIVMLEQAYEDDESVLKIVGKRAKINKYGFKALDDDILQQETVLSVSVGTGATDQQRQLERFVYGLNMAVKLLGPDVAKFKRDEVMPELFGKLGYKDGRRFFEGMDDEDQPENPQLQQAMETIAQLQAELERKHPAELVAAQVEKTKAEAANKNADAALKQVQAMMKRVEALFASMNTAKTAVEVPGVTPVADEIAKSAGFVDMNEDGEIYPEVVGGVPEGAVEVAANTSPNFPPRADQGLMTGVEGGETAEQIVQ